MLLTEREIEFSFSVFEYDCTTNQRHSSECKCNILGLGSTYSFNSNHICFIPLIKISIKNSLLTGWLPLIPHSECYLSDLHTNTNTPLNGSLFLPQEMGIKKKRLFFPSKFWAYILQFGLGVLFRTAIKVWIVRKKILLTRNCIAFATISLRRKAWYKHILWEKSWFWAYIFHTLETLISSIPL